MNREQSVISEALKERYMDGYIKAKRKYYTGFQETQEKLHALEKIAREGLSLISIYDPDAIGNKPDHKIADEYLKKIDELLGEK